MGIRVGTAAVFAMLMAQSSVWPQSRPASTAAPQASIVRPDAVGWGAPIFPASPSSPVSFRLIRRYTYSQRNFTPPYRVAPIARSAARYGTPEEAMIARCSALMTADIDWWLSIWDTDSHKEEAALAAGPQRDRMLASWKDVFTKNRLELVHRIQYGPYVIITYRFVNTDTGKVSDMELPTIFKQEGGIWKATNDLRSDPLIPLSPWASGKTSVQEVMK